MRCFYETITFALIAIAIMFCLYSDAEPALQQTYFVPNNAITSEEVLVDIVNAIIVDFKKSTGCLGESEIKVLVAPDGIYIQVICVCKEAKNESNYMQKMPKACWLHTIQPQSKNISYSRL